MNIILAAGGSGGHIIPAIAVGLECQNKGFPCLVMGVLKFGQERLKKAGLSYQNIPACGWSGLKIFKAVYLLLVALPGILQKFKEFKPDVVVGFGGYSSFPVCFAAWIKGVPICIHEQNVVPGKANKILAKMAAKVFVSFEEGRGCFSSKKTILTGCPLLLEKNVPSKKEALSFFGLDHDVYTILVFGGSQGSRKINRVFIDAVKMLKGKFPFQVIHLLGAEDCQQVSENYKRFGIRAFVSSFLEQMTNAYIAADVVISRAGALTVTELLFFQKAVICIPYPFAGSHQQENAALLTHSEFAQVIQDQELDVGYLIKAIEWQRENYSDVLKYKHTMCSNPAKDILEEAEKLIFSSM